MVNKTKIVRYSHGMRITPASQAALMAMVNYCRSLAQWEWVREPPTFKPKKKMSRVYAGATKDRSEFRFHITQFDDVYQAIMAKGVPSDNIEIIDSPPPMGEEVSFPFIADVTPYEFQQPIVEFLSQRKPRIKVTNLQTGRGKTLIALLAMLNHGVRTVVQLRGGYVKRWTHEFETLFSFKKGEIVVVRGRDALQSVINQAKSGDFHAKIVIITNKTLFNLFKEYETNPYENIYGISPEELYPLLGIGLRIVDEVHEDYHLCFRSDLYCQVDNSIHLSATLETEDVFRRQMYDIALPPESWYKGVAYDRYIGVHALKHVTKYPDKIKINERGRDTYSHAMYEKSIMDNKEMLDNYLEIIRYPVDQFFLDEDFQPGQKCLIFCHLVEFCCMVRDHLLKYYPDLIINEFVSETDESVLDDSDIIVSTVESAGTAHDISDLKNVILTRAIRKKEKNIQLMGRLRRLKQWPDITPKLIYIVNESVETHITYHEAKYEILKDKALYQREGYIPIML